MKKALIAATIVLLLLLSAGGYALYDRLFPVAGPIPCPDEKDVASITFAQNTGVPVPVDSADLEAILSYIRSAQPTRIISVNDYPTEKHFYTIEIATLPGRQHRLFVYAQGSQVYIEAPYTGVYKADPQLLHFIADRLPI